MRVGRLGLSFAEGSAPRHAVNFLTGWRLSTRYFWA
jgi:hypothetical protein